jgi:hypothetical protein
MNINLIDLLELKKFSTTKAGEKCPQHYYPFKMKTILFIIDKYFDIGCKVVVFDKYINV